MEPQRAANNSTSTETGSFSQNPTALTATQNQSDLGRVLSHPVHRAATPESQIELVDEISQGEGLVSTSKRAASLQCFPPADAILNKVSAQPPPNKLLQPSMPPQTSSGPLKRLQSMPSLNKSSKEVCGLQKKLFSTAGIRKGREGNAANAGGRGSGFGRQEIDSLLEMLKEHLPLAREEWEFVVRKHNERYPEHSRTVDSLKRKFASLHRSKVPTGDPTIPADVKEAKHIRYLMTERADIGDGDESSDLLAAFECTEEPEEKNPLGTDETEAVGRGSAEAQIDPASLAVSDSAPGRPLVRKRASKDTIGTSEILELYKINMLQDQTRREDERLWRQELREERSRREREREEERKQRIIDREEERKRRAEESKKHERLMEMFLMSLSKK